MPKYKLSEVKEELKDDPLIVGLRAAFAEVRKWKEANPELFAEMLKEPSIFENSCKFSVGPTVLIPVDVFKEPLKEE